MIQGILETHRERAEQELAAAAGTDSLCVIGRSGRSHPGVKYWEGAAVALGEARRSMASDGGRPGIDEVLGRWVAALAAVDERSADWVAYRTGGVDALRDLLEAIDETPGVDGETVG